MPKKSFANPLTIFFLNLPYGISAGFVSVALPLLLVQKGFTVQTTAIITAIGVSANIWRFLWAPLTDLTLNLHKWYKISVSLCSLSLLALVFVPLQPQNTSLIIAIVFISQVASTFVAAPVGGFMATVIQETKKGRASGFFQAANTGGMGIGGGIGIWLAGNFSFTFSCSIIAICMLFCCLALSFVPKLQLQKAQTVKQGFSSIIIGIKELVQSPVAIYTAALFLTPLASGAASYVWSSVAKDWQVQDETVALVTGFVSAIVGSIGSIIGGFIADKLGRWWVYFSAGLLMALVTILLTFLPFNSFSYINGVLLYALFMGMANAAFSAAILKAIGNNLAATKYAIISSIANIPIVYMTAFNGWLHDAYSVKIMLMGESLLGILFALIFLCVKKVCSIKG